MMVMGWSEKSFVYVSLIVLICVALTVTVSAAAVDFGKSNQLFISKGIVSQVPLVNPGNMGMIKAVPHHMEFYTMIKPPVSAPYYRKPVSYSSITPVSSTSSFGGFIIRGSAEGDWINMRSNFYDPSMEICNGRWHYKVGTTPAYWENMVLPGSYTIQIAYKDTGVVYYTETVTVVAGQTTVVPAGSGGLCPFCSSY